MFGDIRYCVRSLARAPAFTVAVVLTLALGLGGNAAVLGVVDAVLIRPLPYSEPQDLVAITYTGSAPVGSGGQVPSPLFSLLSEESRALKDIAAYNVGSITWLTENREQIRVIAGHVSPRFFFVLGSSVPALGRQLTTQDDVAGAPRVALLSHPFWQTRFGGDRAILGRSLTLNGMSYRIVGIVAEEFRFPGRDTPDVFFPIQLPTSDSSVLFLNAIGRLAEGREIDLAQQEAILVDRRLSAGYPSSLQPFVEAGAAPRVLPLQAQVVGDLRDTFFLMLAVSACVLLLACVNVASLLLARLGNKANDLTTRFAVGATPFQLARQALVEVMILSILGGLAALAAVWLSMDAMLALLAGRIPKSATVSIDMRWLVLLGAAAALAGGLCAAFPLLALSKWNTRVGARAFGRAGVGRSSMGGRYREFLVAAQVGIAMTLLVSSLLLTRSLLNSTGIELGFQSANLLTFQTPGPPGPESARVAGVRELLGRIRTLPGVRSAGATTALPLEGHSFEFAVSVAGSAKPPPGAPLAAVDVASPDYFRALGATLETGRSFDQRDIDEGVPVAIVNEAFAKLRLVEEDPVSGRLSLGGGPADADISIVGVVRDVQNGGPRDEVRPHVYRPFGQAAPQMGWHTLSVVVRTDGDPLATVQSIRSAAAQVGGWVVMYDVRTMAQRLSSLVVPERHRASLTGLFALVALVLAGIGVLSLVSYSVASRMREFGVRLALGARRSQLVMSAMGKGLVPASVGIVFGVVVSLGLSRFLASFLHGTTAGDVGTLFAAALIVFGVAAVASYVPALRASEADPSEILRYE